MTDRPTDEPCVSVRAVEPETELDVQLRWPQPTDEPVQDPLLEEDRPSTASRGRPFRLKVRPRDSVRDPDSASQTSAASGSEVAALRQEVRALREEVRRLAEHLDRSGS